ncbi:MAG TPA: methylenetetrahydrofolate--tRNA-(uracil(54)-C(5))-methyltransferase (FADH(2)-oxidizing) TrmFO [Clostridia bacterium]|nr:methylenetetrahydrofolate--tRNA-(uracil(54)-C(5))-methyltransferase (FADH(2)-oxidizing) TrmFO [Clostridia bacterium]
MPNEPCVSVVGAGLAGCEAAWQLAQSGIPVKLFEMKPHKRTPAHCTDEYAELVCSNSFRSNRLQNAVGLLKEELRLLDSLVIGAADKTQVPAGGALAVDRVEFSRLITNAIKNHPKIQVFEGEVIELPEPPAIIATGPLTTDGLSASIEKLTGTCLHFFDAAAPIVYSNSINMEAAFYASRYGRGSDYINCPMSQAEYNRFFNELIIAQTVKLHSFEEQNVFEGCVPIELLAKRGEATLTFGPLKPAGLVDPRTGKRPFAAVQLRQDNQAATLYNIVGFQTNLTFAEQRRVFSLIPGLKDAEFARYGVMHRNTFLSSPQLLGWDYELKQKPGLYFAGQITGVEGYVESVASGLAASLNLFRKLLKKPALDFSKKTAIGALAHYISSYAGSNFQPMNINYGIMEPLENMQKSKIQRTEEIAKRSLSVINDLKEN